MLRIALISDHASPLAQAGGIDSGGQNIYVNHVARQLARHGHEVDVFTRRDDPALPEVAQPAPRLRVIHVPAGPPRFVRKEALLPAMGEFADFMVAWCRREGGYDLAHANFFMSGLVAMRLKARLGLPFVVTFHALGRVRRQHQGASDEFPASRLTIEEDIVREAAGIVAECPQDKADLLNLYEADAARIRIVPCGYDPEEFWPIPKQLALRMLGFPARSRLLLNIGRLVPRKGVDDAIRGLGLLRGEHGIEATLAIVGGNSDVADARLTPEIGRLQAIAADCGVADRVLFTGRRSRELLKLYYSAADMFITTPWYEPFGITPLEAMACRTPVIGARVGGIQYSVVDGVTGFLVPPRDPASLAACLAGAYRQPRLMHQMGRNAERRVRDHFTWARVGQDLAALFEDVCAGVRPAAAPRLAAAG